ncbi:uncharacterized protein FIBRA_06606 [Fibroporia radiculosa]|uniref:Gfd2/YDR514C-like C-terminal domain-containing protein n=1 Tax=Fibroporia radiculosa TaxID=599839 RepID=J4HZD6_9APHY|nr:uncharacterized protein FIBRA_06606 [Fibroporia radiculosa]CCM04427.1 predicted protein [Fibroporia radiculosa]
MNTKFTVSGDAPSKQGEIRASFEHQRLLCALFREEFSIDDLEELNLSHCFWVRNTRILSVTYNTWAADDRPLTERENDPKILDLGWSEFLHPSQSREFEVSMTRHFIISENRLFNNPGLKCLNFKYGTSETVERSSLKAYLEKLFAIPRSGTFEPTVLLVHDTNRTLKLLQALGINTSMWGHGVAELLYEKRAHSSEHDSRDQRDRDYDPLRRSARSRSPRRSTSERRYHRPRSPPPPTKSIYVVDVRELFFALKMTSSLHDSLRANAQVLGVQETGGIIEKGWCAGNESRLLGQMWFSMARGPNIDDQRELRWSSTLAASVSVVGAAQSAQDDTYGGSDEEVDPNDMLVQAPPVATLSKSGQALMDPGGWDDEYDDDDY